MVEKADEELDGFLADQMASLYNLFYSGAAFVAPMIGAALYEKFKFRGTFDIIQFSYYGIALFYLVFVAGFKAFADHKNYLTEEKRLAAISEKIQHLRNGTTDVDKEKGNKVNDIQWLIF